MKAPRLSSTRAIAASAVILGCAACTGGTSPPVAPATTSTAPTPAAAASSAPGARELIWPDGSIVEGLALDVSQARAATESDYRVVEVISPRWKAQTSFIHAIGPDHQTLLNVFPNDNYDVSTGLLKGPEQIGMRDGAQFKAFRSTRTAVPGDAPRQTFGGTVANGYAAWAETASTNLFTSDWRIFTKDLTTDAEPVLVAKAEDVYPAGELPLAGGEHGPVISADRVFWQTAYEREDGAFRTKVVSAPLTGGDMRTEADLSLNPGAVDGGIVVTQMEDVTVEGADDAWRVQDARRATGLTLIGTGGTARPLISFGRGTNDDWFVGEMAAGATTVALSIDDALHILGTDGKRAVRIQMKTGTQAGGLAVCGDRVMWADVPRGEGRAEHQYVYDVLTEELVSVEVPSHSGDSSCYDDTILWKTFDENDQMASTLTEW